MMNRRNFIQRATSAGVAAALGAHCAPILFANAPDPNNPNDPNAILDPDHEIGKPYVGWKEGELDLHFIHTGITENCFHIYPDGTTTLLDCGDHNWKNFGKTSWNPTKKDEAACQPKPDDSRRCGEWVARYIKRLLPNLETIDYAIASHFHTDHTGGSGAGLRRKGLAGDADYMISGISHVGEYYRFGVAFDRGYPTYDRPTTWSPKERENLIKFWDYAEKTQGLKREEFIVGALDQIKLTKAPEKYNFHIRNLARNGVVWGGPNGETIDFFERYPRNKEENQNENTRSLANLIQYGAFRFYTGGDLCGVLRDDFRRRDARELCKSDSGARLYYMLLVDGAPEYGNLENHVRFESLRRRATPVSDGSASDERREARWPAVARIARRTDRTRRR